MKLKRPMTEQEIIQVWPAALTLTLEIEAAGGTVLIVAWKDIEINGGFKPCEDGRCSECHKKVVEVVWFEDTNNTQMEFHGLACRWCGKVIEYAGFSIGEVDLKDWLG